MTKKILHSVGWAGTLTIVACGTSALPTAQPSAGDGATVTDGSMLSPEADALPVPPEADSPSTTPLQPPGFKDGVALGEAIDINPDPDILEVNIEAGPTSLELVPGTKTNVLAYNGSIPGPVLRAKVGDRIIVHFKNGLSEPSTIHWHGVRVPVSMDGSSFTQDPIPPGGTFDYDFHVPDAGLFWYHPHVDTTKTVSQGLYGALVVEDPAEPAALGDEVTLILSDIDVSADGGILPLSNDPLAQVFGTEGNLILVNGRSRPRLLARSGARQRWRIINAARTRYFNLSLAGNAFVRIGGDGGLIESPITSNTLFLVPGERADVAMVPAGTPGADVPLRWLPYDRGFGSTIERNPEDILTVHIDTEPAVTSSAMPDRLRAIAPLSTDTAHPQDVVMAYAPSRDGGTQDSFQVNDGGDSTMLHAHLGDTDLWTIDNQTDWDHPFHLHGFFFQPLDANGQVIHEWKDTLNVPQKSKRQVVVRYDDRPGDWMFHCHILEHAEDGLMGMLMLSP